MNKELSVEVIWNDTQTNIIGYQEIDPKTLSKCFKESGDYVWVQYANNEDKRRYLSRSQILTNF